VRTETIQNTPSAVNGVGTIVSIKLILMAQKNARTEESLERRLTRIEELLVAHPFLGLPLKEK
jgi:hypothetical protein